MKVLIINTRDISGGAALSTYDLHKSFLEFGIDSEMLVFEKLSDEPTIRQFKFSRNIKKKLKRRLFRIKRQLAEKNIKKVDLNYSYFTSPYSSYGSELIDQIGNPDVILLNWVSGFLDYKQFFSYTVKNKIPVIWRLADIAPITGGCHVAYECTKYQTQCHACPILKSKKKRDLSYKFFKLKNNVIGKIPINLLHLVTISQWEYDFVQKSPIYKRFPKSIIHNGINLNIFNTNGKREAKQVLNIPDSKTVIMVSAELLKVKYKGIEIALQAIYRVRELNRILLLTVGKNEPEIDSTIDHIHKGMIKDRNILAAIYKASDFFIFPTLFEAGGKTFLEAMACGSIPITFSSGAAQDIIENKVDGWLTNEKSIEALTKLLEESLYNDHYEIIRKNTIAKSKIYSIKIQANYFIKLFYKITS